MNRALEIVPSTPHRSRRLSVGVIALLIIVVSCSSDGTEVKPAEPPFIPGLFDTQAATAVPLSGEILELIHAGYSGRWMLYLITRGESGSRDAYHEFVGKGDAFMRLYNLPRATQLIADGTLPSWAEPYFLAPPDNEHALVACAVDKETSGNPIYWRTFGFSVCERAAAAWSLSVAEGDHSSWAEYLINNREF